MRCCRAEPDQDAVLGSPPDPLATNGVWVKGGHPALRMWMGVGALRETGTKVYLHQPWTPHGGWRISHPWCFLCPWNGSLVDYLLDCMPFCSVFSFCPMASWRAPEGLTGGQSYGPLCACPAAFVAHPHLEAPLPSGSSSLPGGFCPLFSDPPRSPCPPPHLAAAVHSGSCCSFSVVIHRALSATQQLLRR